MPVGWRFGGLGSKTQPFATLSTTECELLGYVDGLTLGESVGAIVNVLEQNALAHEGCYVLRGDNLSGLQLLHAPSGPWRTRHLRLRSHVLRERLQMKLWHAEHIPGADPVSYTHLTLPTKLEV